MSTKLYRCEPLDPDKPEGLWQYISPEGEVSSPVTKAFAEKRCSEYNVLVKAGNKLVDYSSVQAMYLENNRTLHQLLKNLVEEINNNVILSCPESVVKAVQEAENYLERNRPG